MWGHLVSYGGIDYSFTLRNFNHIFFLAGYQAHFPHVAAFGRCGTYFRHHWYYCSLRLGTKTVYRQECIGSSFCLKPSRARGGNFGNRLCDFFQQTTVYSQRYRHDYYTFLCSAYNADWHSGGGVAGLQQIDPGLEEASANLGASSSQTLKKKWLYRYCVPLFFAGLLNAFIRSMTSISAVIFLISARWQLLTAAILAAVEIGQLGLAAAYAAVLIVLTSVFMGLLRFGLNRLGKTPTDLSC